MPKKICPLLEARGVFYRSGKASKVDDHWLKFCFTECPLGTDCIYEKPGKISDEDKQALEKVAKGLSP